jgi:hypothetical protein
MGNRQQQWINISHIIKVCAIYRNEMRIVAEIIVETEASIYFKCNVYGCAERRAGEMNLFREYKK